MKKWIALSSIFLLLLTGCGASNASTDKYNQAMGQGKQALEDNDFKSAKQAYEEALNYHQNDHTANQILTQIAHYQSGKKAYKSKQYDVSKTELEQVVAIKDGSKQMVSKANQLLKKIQNKRTNSDTTQLLYTAEQLSQNDRDIVADEFARWAVERAKMHHMAVNSDYHLYNQDVRGDVYISTVDGDMLVEDYQTADKNTYPLHAIGGGIFYYTTDQSTGDINDTLENRTQNTYHLIDENQTYAKYILADNGKVYYMDRQLLNNAIPTRDVGMRVKDASDQSNMINNDNLWQVLPDQSAQEEYQRLLKEHGAKQDGQLITKQTIWDADKTKALNQYMEEHYTSMKPCNMSLNANMINVNDRILINKGTENGQQNLRIVTMEGKPLMFSCSNTASDANIYNVVAAYATSYQAMDDKKETVLLFAIYNGNPVILESHGKTTGKKTIYETFVVSDNQKLNQAFAKIVSQTEEN